MRSHLSPQAARWIRLRHRLIREEQCRGGIAQTIPRAATDFVSFVALLPYQWRPISDAQRKDPEREDSRTTCSSLIYTHSSIRFLRPVCRSAATSPHINDAHPRPEGRLVFVHTEFCMRSEIRDDCHKYTPPSV